MEREYFEVETPVEKKKVKLKKWLTAGEKMEMLKIGQESMLEWMVKTIIVEPTNKEVMAFHGKDFDFLLIEMNKVAGESTWTDEKKN